MSDNYIVELDNVCLKSGRGEEVFSDLCLKLKTGRSVVINGAAGSGKSSLAELLIGRQFAYQGSVTVFDQLIKRGKKRLIKETRRKIGGVGGQFSLIPNYTVAENIIFPMILNGDKKKFRKERLLKMLTEFSLIKQSNEKPENLTRVENMLAQFARAAVAYQPLLIIDEPLAGLDKKTYQRIYDYLVKMTLAGQSMIILSSETLPNDLPNTDQYQIQNGTLV
jgi:ABC-type ATPase involved in cell division